MAEMRRVLRGVIVVAIWLAGCSPTPTTFAAPTVAASGGWLDAYFSDPEAPGSAHLRGGPDEPLQAAIENAHVTIDMAIYNLDLYNIRDALIAAAQRGVQVRLVVESDNFPPEKLQPLADGGISVVGDDDPDLMHNKFTVIDHYEVWTGSLNYTLEDAYGDRNDLVRIRSEQLAENYLAEFEEMYTDGLFGGHSPANTPHPELNINGVAVENYFSPEDGTLAHLVDLVDSARSSVYFLVFAFTSDDLAAALLAAQARGVEVRGVMDKAQASDAGGEYQHLLDEGVDVRLDGEGGSLHDKVLIIDGSIVVTGSYNLSHAAEKRNDENTLVIHDAALASKYLEQFQNIWKLANP